MILLNNGGVILCEEEVDQVLELLVAAKREEANVVNAVDFFQDRLMKLHRKALITWSEIEEQMIDAARKRKARPGAWCGGSAQ
jgi:hypothetical protein